MTTSHTTTSCIAIACLLCLTTSADAQKTAKSGKATTSSPVRSGSGGERVLFDIDESKVYADFVQFEDGHAQGVLVLYLDGTIDLPNTDKILERIVIFCRGTDPGGKAYEDPDNERLVVSRPLSDFTSLSRFQTENNAIIYGVYERYPDGAVNKFALQLSRGVPAPASGPPELGQEYTGR